jgi:hypothetical protein
VTGHLVLRRGAERTVVARPLAATRALAQPDRGVLEHSLLFELPSAWTSAGELSVTAELNPAPLTGARHLEEAAYGNNLTGATVVFEEVPPLDLVVFSVGLRRAGATTDVYPTAAELDALVDGVEALMPVPEVRVRYATYGPWQRSWCDFAFEMMWRYWADRAAGKASADTQYYGYGPSMGGGCATLRNHGGGGGGAAIPDSYVSGYGIAVHEIAHQVGRGHTPYCGADDRNTKEQVYPYANGLISPRGDPRRERYGLHPLIRRVYPPTSNELMGYCQAPWWPSDYTLHFMMDRLQALGAQASAARAALQQRADRLLVSGRIDPATGAATLDPMQVIPDAADVVPRVPGPYAIVLRGAGGAELARYPFTPDAVLSQAAAQLSILQLVPYVSGTDRVDVEGPGGAGASLSAGAATPSVRVLSPNGGEVVAGDQLAVSWSASDADGEAVRATVQYSDDDGATWLVVARDATGTSATVERSNLAAGTRGRIRVCGSDGIHTGCDASDASFTVPSRAASLAIAAPASGSAVVYGQVVALEARAVDPNTGRRLDGELAWRSSLDGELGRGARLGTAALSPGRHTVTLTGPDGLGGTTTATVELTVVATAAELPAPADALRAGPVQVALDPDVGPRQASIWLDNANPDRPLAWTAAARVETPALTLNGSWRPGGSFGAAQSTEPTWLRLSATDGTTPQEVVVTYVGGALPAGTHRAVVAFAEPGGGSAEVVVQVTVPSSYRRVLPLLGR